MSFLANDLNESLTTESTQLKMNFGALRYRLYTIVSVISYAGAVLICIGLGLGLTLLNRMGVINIWDFLPSLIAPAVSMFAWWLIEKTLSTAIDKVLSAQKAMLLSK